MVYLFSLVIQAYLIVMNVLMKIFAINVIHHLFYYMSPQQNAFKNFYI